MFKALSVDLEPLGVVGGRVSEESDLVMLMGVVEEKAHKVSSTFQRRLQRQRKLALAADKQCHQQSPVRSGSVVSGVGGDGFGGAGGGSLMSRTTSTSASQQLLPGIQGQLASVDSSFDEDEAQLALLAQTSFDSVGAGTSFATLPAAELLVCKDDGSPPTTDLDDKPLSVADVKRSLASHSGLGSPGSLGGLT